jgi:hypothetical protein
VGLAPTASLDACNHDEVEVDLTLGVPEPYVGEVHDPEKRPLAGVTISIERMIGPVGQAESRRFLYPYAATVRGTPLEGVLTAKSDERGRFRFPAVPSPGMLTLNADAPGKASHRGGEYPRRGTEEHPALVGPVYPEARLEGRVISSVPGVEVANMKLRVSAIVLGGTDGVLMTDGEGRFQLSRRPFDTMDIHLKRPCPLPEDRWTYRPAYNVNLRPGQTARPTIEIVRGGCLEGRVVDEKSGAPLKGVLVNLRPKDASRPGFDFVQPTDADGRYAARLAPGEWRVFRWDGKPGLDRPIEVVEGKTTVADPIKMPSIGNP